MIKGLASGTVLSLPLWWVILRFVLWALDKTTTFLYH